MIAELGVAVILSGQPNMSGLSLQSPFAEQAKVQQLMMKDVTEKINLETARSEEIATKAADVDEQIKAADAAVADLKSFFVEPAKYSRTSSTNSYVWGNCTWYVKTQRPDIGAFWGNANRWANSARAEGFTVGKIPKIGAIGVSYEGWWGHVFLVTGMNRERTQITISEMNYAGGVGKVHTRTISASGYDYIYNLE